ncbi:uncharacterized protein PHACADRAFT_265620 [Phanerochaete carnosa HHB-10118-sp]|uniref:Uncharacterized protein n=1 Tax=Phanerochaete carnosa (strain HHB-10118-sp) TaxID=650164 RepID=K5VTJ2_PHACS|nr:uncharacterized protein PHACADRAFT_265620 [Phanerochaete carnosa HHB-10118-sp]EKM49874.1 hypothetical protein PHACADRAFT_265620 [Phanerochaete carnosa HHB-10118-sp]
MPLNFAVRESQASPSVSLEKGAYRMRAPLRRSVLAASLTVDTALANTKPPRPHSRSRCSAQAASRDGLPQVLREERQLATLVVLLVCASVACFGGAYYLFTTGPRM